MKWEQLLPRTGPFLARPVRWPSWVIRRLDSWGFHKWGTNGDEIKIWFKKNPHRFSISWHFANGAIQKADWFVSWKIPSFEMDDDRGYPHFGKPPYIYSLVIKHSHRKSTINGGIHGNIIYDGLFTAMFDYLSRQVGFLVMMYLTRWCPPVMWTLVYNPNN